MENTLYIGLSNEMALQRQMSVVANNIANVNTAGYRTQQMLFQNYMAEPDATDRDLDVAMVIDQAVVADLRPGALVQTGNPLDVALTGDAYLVVDTPAGPRYTRNGHLSLDAESRLVDSSGLPLLDTDGQAIEIPTSAAAITIGRDGSISADDLVVARLNVVSFEDPLGIRPLGGGLHVTNEQPRAAEGVEVIQGAIENSNVQPVVELTRMIEISRQYAATQQMMADENNRQRQAIRRLGEMAAG